MNFRHALLTGLLLGLSQLSFGADLFKVAPYLLKHTNGHLLLNFQLNENKSLIIEDGERATRALEYKKDQHYQIELASASCGTAKDLRIKDGVTNGLIFNKNFPQPACAEENKSQEFTFGFISDTQQYRERHEAIAKVIAHHHSLEPLQFLINGGDIVQDGYKEQDWIEYFAGGKAYLMDIPQIAAVGNHDYREKALPKYFQKYFRWNGSSLDGNLYFEMGGFNLVIWNSNYGDLSDDEEGKMWKWLEGKMVASRNANIPLTIVTHYPVYSSSINRFTNGSVKKLRNILVPLVEKYGVKIVLSGHTHMYERSFKDGVNYLVAGPAGGRVNKPTFGNKYRQFFDSSALTFTKIKYSNRTMKLETYNQDNVLIDQLFVNL